MNHYVVRMTQKPCESALSAWTRLLHAHQAATSRVERALKAADLPPLDWLGVLDALERAGEQGLRPFALEGTLRLPQYGMSRLLARMEAAGLVARCGCPEDGRGQVVSLTDAGRAMRRRMATVHAATVQEALGARLSEREAEMLADLLGRLVAPAGPT